MGWASLIAMGIGAIVAATNKPKKPDLPPVASPPPLPTGETPYKRQKKGASARGQAGTILAKGDLIPMDIGKRSLLG